MSGQRPEAPEQMGMRLTWNGRRVTSQGGQTVGTLFMAIALLFMGFAMILLPFAWFVAMFALFLVFVAAVAGLVVGMYLLIGVLAAGIPTIFAVVIAVACGLAAIAAVLATGHYVLRALGCNGFLVSPSGNQTGWFVHLVVSRRSFQRRDRNSR